MSLGRYDLGEVLNQTDNVPLGKLIGLQSAFSASQHDIVDLHDKFSSNKVGFMRRRVGWDDENRDPVSNRELAG